MVTTPRQQIAYRMEVESVLNPDENLYRLEWVRLLLSLSLALLRTAAARADVRTSYRSRTTRRSRSSCSARRTSRSTTRTSPRPSCTRAGSRRSSSRRRARGSARRSRRLCSSGPSPSLSLSEALLLHELTRTSHAPQEPRPVRRRGPARVRLGARAAGQGARVPALLGQGQRVRRRPSLSLARSPTSASSLTLLPLSCSQGLPAPTATAALHRHHRRRRRRRRCRGRRGPTRRVVRDSREAAVRAVPRMGRRAAVPRAARGAPSRIGRGRGGCCRSGRRARGRGPRGGGRARGSWRRGGGDGRASRGAVRGPGAGFCERARRSCSRGWRRRYGDLSRGDICSSLTRTTGPEPLYERESALLLLRNGRD